MINNLKTLFFSLIMLVKTLIFFIINEFEVRNNVNKQNETVLEIFQPLDKKTNFKIPLTLFHVLTMSNTKRSFK